VQYSGITTEAQALARSVSVRIFVALRPAFRSASWAS
jgi:hypothetical protein